jgi:glc operon protein GlcG
MRKVNLTTIVVGAAILICSGAFAQVPPDPNNPNETVPEAMPTIPYGEPINLETVNP